MIVLAIVFLIGVALRIVLFYLDDGLGGPLWVAIYYTSSVTWIIGIVLSIYILAHYGAGMEVNVSWPGEAGPSR